MRVSTTSERFDLYTPDWSLLGEFRLYRTAWERGVEFWARLNIYGGPLITIARGAFPTFLDVLRGRRPLEALGRVGEWIWCMPLCRAEFVDIRREPWGAVVKIYAEMHGEAGAVSRLYDAVLAERDLRRIEKRVGFIHPRLHPRRL
jgi:hypothetical protein